MGRILTAALIVIGLGGLGLVAWVGLHDPSPSAPVAEAPAPAPPPPAPALRSVLVAAGPLRPGTLIKPADLESRSLPDDQIPAGASNGTAQARSALFGAMVRRNLAPGEAILPGDVTLSSDHGFLSAVLQPGMRAMTLTADALASDADLVWPGDRVDIILTQVTDGAQGVSAARRVFGDTVLRDVRILAVDQQLVQGAPAEQAPKGPRTVTVEIAPDQAARLAVASRLGKLAFAIRAANRTADAATATPSATVWAGDVAPGLGKDTAPPSTHRAMRVWQGSADGKEFQF